MTPVRLLMALALAAGCGAKSSPQPERPAHPSATGDWADDGLCARYESALVCAPGAQPKRNVTILSEEGSRFCVASCENAQGQRDGGFVEVDLDQPGFYEQGQFRGGRKNGVWREWDRACAPGATCRGRRLLREEHYRQDLKHGLARRWNADGRLVERGAYLDGELHGVYEHWHEHGQLATRGRFDHGKRVGLHEAWHPTGVLAAQKRHDDVGRPHGEWCLFWPDGSRRDCFVMMHGTGVMREYEGDPLIREWPLRNGLANGTASEHAPHGGNLTAVIRYRDDKRHGRMREWRSGCLVLDATYRDGVLHGPYLEVECNHETGRPFRSVRGTHCHGEPCRTWTERLHDGSRKRVFRYGERGEKVMETTWANGHVVESWDVAKERAKAHARCLRDLGRGGCCDPEQRPPQGARLCFNGDPGD